MKHALILLFTALLFVGCSGKEKIEINTEEGVQKLYHLMGQHIDDDTIINGTISLTSKPLENNIDDIFIKYWESPEAKHTNSIHIYTEGEGKVRTNKIDGFSYRKEHTITFGELKKKLFIWSNIANGVTMVKEDNPSYAFKGVGAYEISYNNNKLVEYVTLQFTDKNEGKSLSGKRILTSYYDVKIRVRDEYFSYVD